MKSTPRAVAPSVDDEMISIDERQLRAIIFLEWRRRSNASEAAANVNDAFEDGETEFHYQRRRIEPRTGSLLIAPAGFTHTHRGNRPKGGNKYIATSWVLFERAEKLYGNPPPK